MLKLKEKTINKVVELPVEEIIPNPAQPRIDFKEIVPLADSIKENGILQPLTVRKNAAGRYELIAGERRLRAAKEAGLSRVPCIIADATAAESAVLAVLENIQRCDLNPIEEAGAIKLLITEWNLTQEEAAARLGMAQSTLANKLRLLMLSPGAGEVVVSRGLTERHARALLKVSDPELQRKIALKAADEELNVAETERLAEQAMRPKAKKKQIFLVKDIRLFMNTMNKAISTMNKAGISSTADRSEDGEYITYTVRIKKPQI